MNYNSRWADNDRKNQEWRAKRLAVLASIFPFKITIPDESYSTSIQSGSPLENRIADICGAYADDGAWNYFGNEMYFRDAETATEVKLRFG